MEPSTVPSAGVDGSGKREGQGADEDETHDLLHDQLLPDGSQGCEARRGAMSAERPAHLSNANSRSCTADPSLPRRGGSSLREESQGPMQPTHHSLVSASATWSSRRW